MVDGSVNTTSTAGSREKLMDGPVLSLSCAALLVLHLGLRFSHGKADDGLDAVALGLAVMGLAPFIATVVESLKFGGVEVKFLQEKVDQQRADLEQLRFLIRNFLSSWEVAHLENLHRNALHTVDTKGSPSFQTELRHLRSHAFIDHLEQDGKRGTIGAFFDHGERDKRLGDYFKITEVGEKYLELRNMALPPK